MEQLGGMTSILARMTFSDYAPIILNMQGKTKIEKGNVRVDSGPVSSLNQSEKDLIVEMWNMEMVGQESEKKTTEGLKVINNFFT